jgi:3-(3-hydroxy-phenyl)propionate hydroxylase
MSAMTYDVAVVGAGPVGLTLTGLLMRQGLSVALLDRGELAVAKPRATHIDDEVVRTFQAIGVAHELEPDFHATAPFTLYDKDRTPHLGITNRPDISEQGWRYDYMFHQPDFERRMREILGASPLVTTQFGVEVTRVVQDADGAAVEARSLADGQASEVRARYVVGCDGARSIVRRSMGVALDDLHGTQRWLVVDLLINEGVEGVEEALYTYAAPAPARTFTFVATGRRRRRIEFKTFDRESAETLEDPQTVWGLVERWATPETAVIERADVYEFNALVAQRWSDGRLFLAGDAAHQMPPKAGQGLCSGMRDASNLAWKLGFCLKGLGDDALLDTYESERMPHTRLWIEISNGIAQAIERLSEGEAPRARGEQSPDSRPPIGPGLHGEAAPPAGLLSYQPFLADGTRLDDRVGIKFAVIATPELLDRVTAVTRAEWDALGVVVLTAAEARYGDWLAERGSGAVIIRPDRYILGVAATAPELDQLTSRLRDALAATGGRSVAA